ncbi:MAG TPA: hypothetical protein VN823_05975 [Stellaceae bacterium]|nr:hypothetical protein [Stellaceae bacterium]
MLPPRLLGIGSGRRPRLVEFVYVGMVEHEIAHPSNARAADAIGTALERAGVVFIAENGGGRGVRLRKKGKR